MRVLAIIHAPVFSGPHNRTTTIARIHQQQGIETTVLLPEGGEEAAERIRAAGVDVRVMPMHRARTLPDPRVQLAWLRSLRAESDAIATVIRDEHYDVVVTNTLPNLHGAFAAKKANAALVWEIIDTFPPMWFRRLWMPYVKRRSDAILTTGRKVAEEHPGVTGLGDRWLTFFPCVDTEKFTASPAARAAARVELGLPQDALVIGNVAAMSPMKGHVWFIRAAAMLRRTHPQVRYAILGSRHADRDDYYRDLYAEAESLGLRIGSDLIIVDPKDKVSCLMQAFDLFWMTSEPHSEGIPTVIGEAKSLGLPVVTTDVGSTSECVTDGVSGHVVPPRDPSAIAEATMAILGDPDRMASMKAVARQEAEAQFAMARGAEQHRLAFERAIAHHAATSRS